MYEVQCELIKTIGRNEKMPQEWKVRTNYRGIALLNNACKMLSSIWKERLANISSNLIGKYQYKFM